MSDDSLFSKHLRIISEDPQTWSPEVRKESEYLQSLRLPELELKTSWRMKFKSEIQLSLGALLMASFALIFFLPRHEILTPKGAFQVSVFVEHEGKLSPLKSESLLKDGDKVAASVNSAEDSYAYWAITDHQLKVLTPKEDIESSRLFLPAGVSKSFESSFVLVAPNQGEHLVVVVCPKSENKTPEKSDSKKPIDSLFNHDFVTQLQAGGPLQSSQCIFVGYRLRRLP